MDEGRVMVLTGCASGIGRHLAGALARAGHRVLATDLNEAGLVQQAREGGWSPSQVLLRRLDVRDAAEWDSTLELARTHWGRIDVLMNIAGFLRPGRVHETSIEDIELHIDVNLKGTVLGTRAAARHMIRAGRGHIINFGSLASLAPVAGLALYAASKFAVRGFSLAAAGELRPHGIYVTVVMPDAVQTPMLDKQLSHEEAALTFSGARPLRVEDIERVLFERILPKRPIEIAIPRARAALARVANTVPQLHQLIAPMLEKKGRAHQARIRARRSG